MSIDGYDLTPIGPDDDPPGPSTPEEWAERLSVENKRLRDIIYRLRQLREAGLSFGQMGDESVHSPTPLKTKLRELVCNTPGCRVRSFHCMSEDDYEVDGVTLAWHSEDETAWSALRTHDCPGCGEVSE